MISICRHCWIDKEMMVANINGRCDICHGQDWMDVEKGITLELSLGDAIFITDYLATISPEAERDYQKALKITSKISTALDEREHIMTELANEE